jgi:putative glutamine amidotransferase
MASGKPIIGITLYEHESRYMQKPDYVRSVENAGGVPLLIPYITNSDSLDRIIEGLDGLLLSGGSDVDPGMYGEEPLPELGEVVPERDRTELLLLRRFMKTGKPVLGICRGCQLLNVAAGGTLYQDIARQCETAGQHAQKASRSHLSHHVKVEPASALYRIAGTDTFKVNSFHHQAVKRIAPDFTVTARAPDGTVEAIEGRNHPFLIGVQWHPEDTAAFDEPSARLFAAFVEACSR